LAQFCQVGYRRILPKYHILIDRDATYSDIAPQQIIASRKTKPLFTGLAKSFSFSFTL
jgi:hypothetical protein